MKWIVVIAAMLGLSSVIMGAVGDHLLERRLTAQSAEYVAVALRYHQLYSIILLSIALYGLHQENQKILMAASLTFLAGIVIFSGSLYGSAFADLSILTAGTPIGGLLLMTGWILIAVHGFFHKDKFKR